MSEDREVAEPGLRVALRVRPGKPGDRNTVAISVDVAADARPMRVSVYLDGSLMETWAPPSGDEELRLRDVHGRHVLTARAVDATGRWGGASTLVEL